MTALRANQAPSKCGHVLRERIPATHTSHPHPHLRSHLRGHTQARPVAPPYKTRRAITSVMAAFKQISAPALQDRPASQGQSPRALQRPWRRPRTCQAHPSKLILWQRFHMMPRSRTWAACICAHAAAVRGRSSHRAQSQRHCMSSLCQLRRGCCIGDAAEMTTAPARRSTPSRQQGRASWSCCRASSRRGRPHRGAPARGARPAARGASRRRCGRWVHC